MEIDYDYLRTGTAIGFRASRELCSNYLLLIGHWLPQHSVRCLIRSLAYLTDGADGRLMSNGLNGLCDLSQTTFELFHFIDCS